MKAFKIDIFEMIEILRLTNLQFDNNIKFKTIEQKNNHVNFTLKPITTNKPGYKINRHSRKISAACFHVHYKFILEFYRKNLYRRLYTCLADYRGYIDFFNKFENVGLLNVGSQALKQNFCQACNCNNYVYEKLH